MCFGGGGAVAQPPDTSAAIAQQNADAAAAAKAQQVAAANAQGRGSLGSAGVARAAQGLVDTGSTYTKNPNSLL